MTTANANRLSLRATFERITTARDPQGRPIESALLVNVTDADGTPVARHAWMTWGEKAKALCLQPGDAIALVAEVQAERGVTLKQPRGMTKL